MKIIGIMSIYKEKNSNEPYDNYYKIISAYVDRIKELNCIPVGILDCDNLDIFDAIIIPGGTKITIDHYKVIDYCIKKSIPVLGICMGMQAMIMYDYLSNICNKDNIKPIDLVNKYDDLIKNNHYILETVYHHGGELVRDSIIPNYENINNSKHEIKFEKNSFLYDIYKKDKIDVISMHNYGYKGNLNDFDIVAKSTDGVVEAIIHKNKLMIGLQFHIELDPNQPIFKKFISEVVNEKRL